MPDVKSPFNESMNGDLQVEVEVPVGVAGCAQFMFNNTIHSNNDDNHDHDHITIMQPGMILLMGLSIDSNNNNNYNDILERISNSLTSTIVRKIRKKLSVQFQNYRRNLNFPFLLSSSKNQKQRQILDSSSDSNLDIDEEDNNDNDNGDNKANEVKTKNNNLIGFGLAAELSYKVRLVVVILRDEVTNREKEKKSADNSNDSILTGKPSTTVMQVQNIQSIMK